MIITGLGYILFYKKDDDEKSCVDKPKDEPEIKPEDEKGNEIDVDQEIKNIVLSGDYNNPGDLVLLIINTVVQKAKSGFEILQRVPKNIEELEEGEKYRICYKVSSYTSGSVQVRVAWDVFEGELISSALYEENEFIYKGAYTHQKEISFRPGPNGFVGSIDVVELVKIS